jgi:hypothetical protein
VVADGKTVVLITATLFLNLGKRSLARAEELDHAGVLRLPQLRPTVHDSVEAMLEVGVDERLQQASGEREMNAPESLVGPQRARNAVHRPQDLPGLRFPRLEQVLEVARRLVKVENEGRGRPGGPCDPSCRAERALAAACR